MSIIPTSFEPQSRLRHDTIVQIYLPAVEISDNVRDDKVGASRDLPWGGVLVLRLNREPSRASRILPENFI
jgi:hypothetical protein